MLHRLRALGLSARVIEAASGVGGTWYWNCYPGSRCDTESMTYSYSFSDDVQQEWEWSARYATQPEILKYMNHVTDRFDLRRDMQFETRVTAGAFDESTNRWRIETDRGERLTAKYCVMATGCLSRPRVPDYEGLDSFEGDWYHTGFWPHEDVDFTGKRVAVIGTGSSGIQSIPVIARQAAHLTVFQRTPNYSIPAWDGPLPAAEERQIKANYADFRRQARETSTGLPAEIRETSALETSAEEREREFETRWTTGGFPFLFAYGDTLTDGRANELAAEFVRGKIRERVDDPAVAELLCPDDHPFGTKRLCVDTDYYEAYNRDNVTLVSLRESPIAAITPRGLRTSEADFDVDAIVFATGFDAMTGALFNIDIRGRDGVALKVKVASRPAGIPWNRECRVPKPVHDHWAWQPIRRQQHDGVYRTARRLGDRVHRAPRAARVRVHRADRRGRRRVGRARQRDGCRHTLSRGELVVRGRKHPGEVARLRTVHRRRCPVPREVRGRCRERLRRVRARRSVAVSDGVPPTSNPLRLSGMMAHGGSASQ